MSGSGSQWSSATAQIAQRSPLQVRGALQDQNNVNGSQLPSSSHLMSIPGKRVNTEPILVKSENEPVSFSKRQRTKSGSHMDMTIDSSCNLSECFLSKSEPSPLSDRNARHCKFDGGENGLTEVSASEMPFISRPSLNVKPDELEKMILVSSSKLAGDNHADETQCKVNGVSNSVINCIDSSTMDGNPDSRNGHLGGMSPHCAATMDYVTRLPEGCSANPPSPDKLNDEQIFSDEELEEDDNYLDSSGAEDNDTGNCILNNDDDDEDGESCGEDDQSVISSITVGSTSSLRSIASETVNSICMNENGVASNEDGSPLYSGGPSVAPLPALCPSLFPHVPPVINFCEYNEVTEKLPDQISKLLKWKFTTITPMIVRKTISNSGFKINKKTLLWVGTWGKHMKANCFKTIKLYQKVNHIPGTFQIGRKDKLWKNFARLQAKYGKEDFGFLPKTFVLPGDVKALKAAFDKEGVKKKWIVKPPASARGTGIQVVHKWSQMPTSTPAVVQRYISMPYLINNTKFDIRIYVLVTSFHPLQIFLYEDGLIRFASVQYQKASKSLSDRYMHLTNYSVNKNSSSYSHNDDAGHCQGHKWTLKTLWGYLKAQSVDTGALWSKIADLVIKTIICGELDIVNRGRKMPKSRYSCFELFGVDVILDEKLRPWLLEVNISPSLHSASSLDHSVKGPLIADTLNIAGYHIPDKLMQETQVELLNKLNLGEEVSSLCLDRRLYTKLLTPQEQTKHLTTNSQSRPEYLQSVLEDILPDDARHLVTFEDRLSRAGKFTCIFPTSETHHYLGFMDRPRYYNRMMDAWETTYGNCREQGIELLIKQCHEKHHLSVPSTFRMPKTACLPPSAKDWKAISEPVSLEKTPAVTETSLLDDIEVKSEESLIDSSRLKLPAEESCVSVCNSRTTNGDHNSLPSACENKNIPILPLLSNGVKLNSSKTTCVSESDKT